MLAIQLVLRCTVYWACTTCTYFLLKKYDYLFRRLIVNSRENLLKTLTEFYFWSVIIPWEVTKSLRLCIPKIVLAENYCVHRWSPQTLKWKFKCRSFLKELIEILTKRLTYKVCVFRLRRFLLDWKKVWKKFPSWHICHVHFCQVYWCVWSTLCAEKQELFEELCWNLSPSPDVFNLLSV